MIISNPDEYSSVVGNFEFCAFRQEREFVVSLNNGLGELREIVLSPDEARQLREHLNDPETMHILGLTDISGVKCPGCGRMVGNFQSHACRGDT